MKITCSKESLIKILGTCGNVISTKNNISILSNVLIEAKDSRVKIKARETTMDFFGDIGADITKEGAVSVYCDRLYSIIRKLPGDEIVIESNKEHLVTIQPVGNNNIIYHLKGVNAEKFPPIKTIEDIDFFSIKQSLFIEMINKTKFAVSITENRRFVSGILFEKYEDTLRMVATDGKRMAFIKKAVDLPNLENVNIIVPPKVLLEVVKLCSGNGDVLIALTKENIYINIDNSYFISNLLEAVFPPYEKVIPKNQDKFFKINRKEFNDSIDRISLLGDKESHKIILSVDQERMKIFTENITLGSGEEIIPVEYEFEPIKIAFNYVYLLEVLAVLKNEKVVIRFNNPKGTITIHEENDNDYICIMIPMSI